MLHTWKTPWSEVKTGETELRGQDCWQTVHSTHRWVLGRAGQATCPMGPREGVVWLT